MCKRNCIYCASPFQGETRRGEHICNYHSIKGRTRTATLIDLYKKQGKVLSREERTRILTDDMLCPFYESADRKRRKKNELPPGLFEGQRTTAKRCEQCGNTYYGGPRARFCPECRGKQKKEYYAEYRIAKLVKTRTCERCGSHFEGGPKAHYCPDCRRNRFAEGGKIRAMEIRARKERNERRTENRDAGNEHPVAVQKLL